MDILFIFGRGADLRVVILQVVHMIQHPSSVFSILQQGTYIQHVVHVCLDLDMQLLALCLLQILVGRFILDITTSHICKRTVVYHSKQFFPSLSLAVLPLMICQPTDCFGNAV